MESPSFQDSYDVIVIGAGISGLTNAAILSKAGMKVCVLEMDKRPGGYLAGFERKNFRFDSAIHWLNQCNREGLVYRVFSIIGNDFPKPVAQKRIKRYKGPGYDYLLTNNPDDLKEQWIREFPNDKKGIIKFFKEAKKVGRSFSKYGYLFRSMETMNLWQKSIYGLKMLKFVLPFLRFLKYSGEEKIEKGLSLFFKDPKLRSVFNTEMDLLSCLVPFGWAYYGDYQSPPNGGSQVFPEWLSHVIDKFDGEIHFRSIVKEVLVENNTVKGVRVDQRGKSFTLRSKYVIGACDVETLYEKMLPQSAIPEKIKSKLKEAKLYSSSVTISLALDVTAEELGFNEEMVFVSEAGISRHAQASGDPHTSAISILAPTFRDKSLAPEGRGTVTLYVPAFFEYEDNWKTYIDENGKLVRGKEYKNFKNEFSDIIIERVERHLNVNLKDHILFCDIATPITHWRYTGNRAGSIMGARPGKENIKAKVAHYKTPIKNLILSGHWAELGGGVPVAVKAAMNTSLIVLQKEDKKLYKLLCKYCDGSVTIENVLSSELLRKYENDWVQIPTPANGGQKRTFTKVDK